MEKFDYRGIKVSYCSEAYYPDECALKDLIDEIIEDNYFEENEIKKVHFMASGLIKINGINYEYCCGRLYQC